MSVGKASGKRTLADAMDEDVRVKKHRTENTLSKFFSQKTGPSTPGAGPSRFVKEKENIPVIDSDDDDDNSVLVNGHVDMQMEIDVDEVLLIQENSVDQEDGYLSPTPSQSLDVDDLSSPVRPSRSSDKGKCRSLDDIDFGADVLSSPPAVTPRRSHSFDIPRVLCSDTPPVVCDLRKSLGVDDIESDLSSPSRPHFATPPNLTPPSAKEEDDEDELKDAEVLVTRKQVKRQTAVAEGWKKRFAFTSLNRSNTNITPAGRHRGVHPYFPTPPHSAPTGYRTSLVFVDTLKKKNSRDSSPILGASRRGESDGPTSGAKAKLAKFRCVKAAIVIFHER
ncbi:hypothetical protein CPB85DRAFT_307281 [Mucidula mucida]|nr:hypothetical protein CPB85DRAFT_307281 [Mucidula mucida]